MGSQNSGLVERTALVIPVYGNWPVTELCLTTLFECASENPPCDVVVIDDGSNDMTALRLREYPVTTLVNERNMGYVYSTNRGIKYALESLNATNIVLMNNDLEFKGAWLKYLLNFADRYDIVGYFGRIHLNWRRYAKTSYVEFSCALVKREVLLQVGMIDPIYRSGYSSDDDFCLRALTNGYKIVQVHRGVPQTIKHFHGQTFGTEERYVRMREEFQTFLNRWGSRRDDPVVDKYFRRFLFNPVTGTYGEQSKLRKRVKGWLGWGRQFRGP